MSKTLFSQLVTVLIAPIALLAGCADRVPTPPGTGTSTPRPVVTVTATVTATPSSVVGNTTTTQAVVATAVLYRLRAEFLDAPDVSFEVVLNGQKVGTFAADSRSDVTPIVRQGGNTIDVTWKKSTKLEDSARAQVYLESQRPGQEDWNTLFSCEVSRKTSKTSARGTFEVGTAATSSGASDMASPQAQLDTPTPAALTERYSIKVQHSTLAPAEFSLAINGEQVGTFTSNADQDITSYVVPGKNTATIGYRPAGEFRTSASESKLTIGVDRDGTWSTVANQAVRKANPEGSRTVEFTAR